MSWRHPTADDFDHSRDLAKHEPRLSDPVANHPVLGKYQPPAPELLPDFPAPSLLAIETALMVRNKDLKLTAAAQLIEQYARAEADRGRLEAVAAGAGA